MKKITSLLLALLMLVFCFAACSGETNSTDFTYKPENAKAENGKIVIGLDDTFAPMGFRDESGNLVGFDIDLAMGVADVLECEVTFKPIDWDSKELLLENGKIDCVWNGMSATEERQESMALTNKYLNNKIIIMVKKGNDVKSVEELASLNIGTQTASAALETMEAHEAYDSFKDKIQTFDTYDEVIMALEAGRIDCMVVDQVLGEYKNAKSGQPYDVTSFDFGDDFYAIGCKKGNTELADKINGAIKSLIDSGRAAEISENWFGKNIVIFEDYAD